MAVEYEFISSDVTELETEMISTYETLSEKELTAASPEKLMIQWALAMELQWRVNSNYAANQNIPSRATGDNLDALGELVHALERPAASAASVTIRFYISAAQKTAILIPSGTRVTDESETLYWATTEDTYIAAGDTYADVEAECQTTGTAGNGWAEGTINSCVDLFSYYSSCENITESDGGSDEYTDDEFRALFKTALAKYSTTGTYPGYEYYAMSVSSEISAVLVNSPAPGFVYIYALMDDGSFASDEMKEAIREAVTAEDTKILTDNVVVADPDEVTYDIDITYYLFEDSDISASDAAEAVEAAVDEFVEWQQGKLGRDINPSKLISLLMETGIKRVEVSSPVFTVLQDGILEESTHYDLEDTIPQVAHCSSITITNGGAEDE